jgi:aryl-alcohol dehydrogenase-like predicted oxidoreductase
MRYKLLGNSGLKVSEISLGTMTFGEEWGFGAGAEDSRKIFDLYRDAGGNFIDTANKYTEGTSERMVGEFVGKDRERFVIATKYTLSMRSGDPNASGTGRKNMVQSVEASLKRLGTEYIDLLWVHAWDHVAPVEEVMRGLDDLVRAGKVLYVGVSDAPAWVVSRANTMAELRGWSRFIGLQIEYSLIERTVERELTPMARELGLGILAWAPIGGGVLTGKYTRGDAGDSKRKSSNAMRLSDRNLAIARTVDAIADELGKSSTQVAINWLRQRDQQVIPIVGARTLAQIQDSLGSTEFQLDGQALARLDEVSRVELGFPHDFLGQSFIKDVVYGDTRERLDR